MAHPLAIKEERSPSLPFAAPTSSKKSKQSTQKKCIINRKKSKQNTTNIDFESCYRFEATCPFKECDDYKKTIFRSQQSYQQHHALKHERRDKFRNNLVWRCPQCLKICSSFYNFSAHVSMHRELCQPPWICTLSSLKHNKNYNHQDKDICGKRSSTKNNLISHIRAVHKFNAIGYRQGRCCAKKHVTPIENNHSKKRKRDDSSDSSVTEGQSDSSLPKRARVDEEHHSLHPFLCDTKPTNVFPGFNPINCNNNNNNNLPTMRQLNNMCHLLETQGNQTEMNDNNPTDLNTVAKCLNYIKKCRQQQPQQQQHKQPQQQQQQKQQKPPHHHHHHHHHFNHNHHTLMNGTVHHRNCKMNPMNQMRIRNVNVNVNKNINAMNHMNRVNNMNNMNMSNLSDQNKITLSIQNMIATLNRMEHLSNINGLGMAHMTKMNNMFAMSNIETNNSNNNNNRH